jgi:hypothetical protein
LNITSHFHLIINIYKYYYRISQKKLLRIDYMEILQQNDKEIRAKFKNCEIYINLLDFLKIYKKYHLILNFTTFFLKL